MSDVITWVEPKMATLRGKLSPGFVEDDRYTAAWWSKATSFGPPAYQWRSYTRHGEEIARILLSLRFRSHSFDSSTSALLIWNFEVRDDLRCGEAHVGTTIIKQLVREYSDWEIYIGPTPESENFWRRFGWPMCNCYQCGSRDFIVRRP